MLIQSNTNMISYNSVWKCSKTKENNNAHIHARSHKLLLESHPANQIIPMQIRVQLCRLGIWRQNPANAHKAIIAWRENACIYSGNAFRLLEQLLGECILIVKNSFIHSFILSFILHTRAGYCLSLFWLVEYHRESGCTTERKWMWGWASNQSNHTCRSLGWLYQLQQ